MNCCSECGFWVELYWWNSSSLVTCTPKILNQISIWFIQEQCLGWGETQFYGWGHAKSAQVCIDLRIPILFDSQVDLNSFDLRHKSNQPLIDECSIHHQVPFDIGVGCDQLLNMAKIVCRACGYPHVRSDNLACLLHHALAMSVWVPWRISNSRRSRLPGHIGWSGSLPF